MAVWILTTIMLILSIYSIIITRKNKNITQQYKKLLSQKKSSEVRLGQISEQIAPFLKGFNYDTRNTKFLGQPIDLICFEPDKVVFVEVKTGKSQLSQKQKDIKHLIKKKIKILK
jgi:predicted Holliday junction resolvase-like endonuclease